MFYEQLEKRCTEKKILMTSLTKDMNMSKGNISNWRKGGFPSAEKLIEIADYLDCSVDYLLCRTENPEINKNPLQK